LTIWPGEGGAVADESQLNVVRVATSMTAMSLSGFLSDVAKEIASRMGATVEWVPVPWEALLAPEPALFDMGVQFVAITPQRREIIDFSEPFLVANQTLIAREDSDLANAKNIDDVRAGRLGGYREGAAIEFVRTVIRPTEAPVEFDSPFETGKALSVGDVEGTVFPAPVAIALSKQFQGLTVVGRFDKQEQYGIVFHRGSPLREPVNSVLARLKADSTLQGMIDKWFPEIEGLPELT
jgi:polar amino acid transport system substrate-binding protein